MKRTHLAIRLALHGCTNRPFYHVVVMKKHLARSSEHIVEQVGSYDPMLNRHNERVVALNFDRIKHWLACGAVTSEPVARLLGLSGYFPIHPTTILEARRNRAVQLQSNEQSGQL